MKKLLISLLLVGSLCQAQDKYIDLKLVGPKTIEITNKNFMQMGLEVRAPGMTSIIPDTRDTSTNFLIVPIGKSVYTYTGKVSEISMKATQFGMWLGEMSTWVSIPTEELNQQVLFKSITAKKVDSSHINVTFEVDKQINVKQYNIQVSSDGKEWQTKTIIFPDVLKSKSSYSVTVKY